MAIFTSRIFRLSFLFVLLNWGVIGKATEVPLTQLTGKPLEDRLHWVRDPEHYPLCRGYYDSTEGVGDKHGKLVGQTFSAEEVSLSGSQELGHKPLRHSQLNDLHVSKEIQFSEPGLLFVGQDAQFNLKERTFALDQLLYLFKRPSPYGPVYARGAAAHVEKSNETQLTFNNASYTTCSPAQPVWTLAGDLILLDKASGWGSVTHSRFYVGKVPIFYWPYFQFPIDDRRHSGLLLPTLAKSNQNGLDITIPVYWNIAPSMDATFQPRWLSDRGLQSNLELRYLSHQHSGELFLSWLNRDRAFAAFRRNAASMFGISDATLPYLNALNQEHNYRGYISYNHHTQWSSQWATAFTINYVTDPYFFQNIGVNSNSDHPDQLLNQMDMTYNSEHWYGLMRLQGTQTLHQINQYPISNVYRRLPQFEWTAHFSELPWGLSTQWDNQWIYFSRGEVFETGDPVVQGHRLFVDPKLSRPFVREYGSIVPTIELTEANYWLQDQSAGVPHHIGRFVPILSVDSQLQLERDWSWNQVNWLQTLEPRAFYVFIPYRNQDNLPEFDTQSNILDYDQLFKTNRFSGPDRIGDDNRIALGFTSRLLNRDTGKEKARFSMGGGYAFQGKKVCLTPGCVNDMTHNLRWSAFSSEFNYQVDSRWSLSANSTIQPKHLYLDKAGLDFHYSVDNAHQVDLSYNYLTTTGGASSAEQVIQTGLVWQLNPQWTGIANTGYDLRQRLATSYLYGLSYESCCWAVRLLRGRELVAAGGVNNAREFNRTIYVQIAFKGLGGVGNSSPTRLLRQGSPGYNDPFNYNTVTFDTPPLMG